jgi:hypothetical protein
VDYSQQNTPQAGKTLAYITIIHPHHPLVGQRVRAVRQTGSEAERQWVIELDDQSHACIPLSWAVPDDQAADAPWGTAAAEGLWADVTGLLKLARMIRNLCAFEPTEEMGDEATIQDSTGTHGDSGFSQPGAAALGTASSGTPPCADHSIGGDDGQATVEPEPCEGGG